MFRSTNKFVKMLGEEKMAKELEQSEEEYKINGKQIGKSSKVIVCMAIEVWADVFGFIKRIQLARTISLTNRLIHQICWPRLHGNKVKAHEVYEMEIGSGGEFNGHPASTALMLKNGTKMPLASWPLPPYITGFSYIFIKFLDEQVVELLKHIFSRVAATKDKISLCVRSVKELDEKQRVVVGQLLKYLSKGFLLLRLHMNCCTMASLLQDVDNKVEQKITLAVQKKVDISFLMKILATPRPNGHGKQRAIHLHFYGRNVEGIYQLAWETLYAIKKEFQASTKPLPQPFSIRIWKIFGLDFVEIEEENQQTGEILRSYMGADGFWDIYRHPKGHEQLMEDGKKRLKLTYYKMTNVILKFGA